MPKFHSMKCRWLAWIVVVVGCGGASSSTAPPRKQVDVQNQIIGTRGAEGTARELRERGERALLARKWQDAALALEALLAGDPSAKDDPQVLYDLALAYEGTGEREKARTLYRDVSKRFASHALARSALVREVSLDAYLEDWAALGQVAEAILARTDIEPADKMLGLGARALAKLEAKDDALSSETSVSRDINQGLDLVDEHRYGATGQLPVAAAMLKYALGELRRIRSEKISLDPPGPDFVQKLEMRCAGLLDAQAAYADAIRSVDLHWAAMSGFRVGEMYRTLHKHLMMIPPTEKAKTESDRQLFYGIMHVRYRALLEKGIEMMKRTLGLGERTGVASAWMKRAEAAKDEMEKALEEEKAAIKKMPFTEEELEKALALMKKKAMNDAEKASKKK